MRQIENIHLISKPTSSVCNLDCSYCFYLEKEKLHTSKQDRKIDDKTLTNYVIKNIVESKGDTVDFYWQGGEPTLMGLSFFEKALALQQQHKGHKKIVNYLQTNGTKLNDEWCGFFSRNNFLIGLSIDGPKQLHDHYRKTKSADGSFDSVMKGLNLLRKHEVNFNTLTVVNSNNVKHPLEIYHFLKDAGSQFIQFLPLFERHAINAAANDLIIIPPSYQKNSTIPDWSVNAAEYGDFLIKIFDEWLLNDLSKIHVMNFEQTMSQMLGRASTCITAETCGDNLVLEANGDIYSCDHFVYPEYKIGNINKDALLDMANSSENITFANNKKNTLSQECTACEFKKLCNGGCPKYRISAAKTDGKLKDYFCTSTKKYLSHAVPKFTAIYELMDLQYPPTEISRLIRQHMYQ